MKGFVVGLLLASCALAQQPKCEGNPKVVAACYVVHGRASLGADSVRVRIWPVGTKRMLGVTGGPTIDDAINAIYPKQLEFVSPGDDIYGDFLVCPLLTNKRVPRS